MMIDLHNKSHRSSLNCSWLHKPCHRSNSRVHHTVGRVEDLRTFIKLIHHRQFPLPSVRTFSVLAGFGSPSYERRFLVSRVGFEPTPTLRGPRSQRSVYTYFTTGTLFIDSKGARRRFSFEIGGHVYQFRHLPALSIWPLGRTRTFTPCGAYFG